MPYREKITKAGRTILIERGYTSRYNQKGGTRRKHMQPTKEAQEKANIRKSEKDMTILMNANFNPGDMHVVMTYDPEHRPETLEQVKADRKEFINRLRKACRKLGIRLIYTVYLVVEELEPYPIHYGIAKCKVKSVPQKNGFKEYCLTEKGHLYWTQRKYIYDTYSEAVEEAERKTDEEEAFLRRINMSEKLLRPWRKEWKN